MLHLDNEELLDIVASRALVHTVPGSVGEGTANGPHDGDSSLSRAWRCQYSES